MPPTHHTQVREIGQRRIKIVTILAVGAAVVGTSALAASVAREDGAKADQTTRSASQAGTRSKGFALVPSTGASPGPSGATGPGDDTGPASVSGTSGSTGVSGGRDQQDPAPAQPQASSGG